MGNHSKLCMVMGLVGLAGCSSPPPTSVKHVSLAIFEVVDCKTGGTASMSLKGSTEKYCLAAKPVVDETEVRAARASRDESGEPQLLLFFSLKTGQRMRETTQRIYQEHLRHNDPGRMGIVIDGALISVPTLTGIISDTLVIRGGFNWQDAVQIAESLNAEPQPQSSSSNGQK